VVGLVHPQQEGTAQHKGMKCALLKIWQKIVAGGLQSLNVCCCRLPLVLVVKGHPLGR